MIRATNDDGSPSLGDVIRAVLGAQAAMDAETYRIVERYWLLEARAPDIESDCSLWFGNAIADCEGYALSSVIPTE